LRATGYAASDAPHALLLARGSPVPLSSSRLPLALEVRERFTFREAPAATAAARWRLRVVEYSYAIRQPDVHGEVLAYHYHPQIEGIAFPHLHLGSSILREPALASIHLPTGWVGLEAVVELTLRDLGVAPLRPDWAVVLAECGAAVAETRGSE